MSHPLSAVVALEPMVPPPAISQCQSEEAFRVRRQGSGSEVGQIAKLDDGYWVVWSPDYIAPFNGPWEAVQGLLETCP